MSELMTICIALLALLQVGILLVLLRRRSGGSDVGVHLITFEKGVERIERSVKEEIARNRDEASASAKVGRDEQTTTLSTFSQRVGQYLTQLTSSLKERLDAFRTQFTTLNQSNDSRLEHLRQTVESKLTLLQSDANKAATDTRTESQIGLETFRAKLTDSLSENIAFQKMQFDTFSTQLVGLTRSNEERFETLRKTLENKIMLLQSDANSHAIANREILTKHLGEIGAQLLNRLSETVHAQQIQFEEFSRRLHALTELNDRNASASRESIEHRLGNIQSDAAKDQAAGREEQSRNAASVGETLARSLADAAATQKEEVANLAASLGALATMTEHRLEKMRETVEARLASIQNDNALKLEAMRQTVDEKLHATLEQRLGESFKIVSDRLEIVHKGLGEMQNLANGVGDLKKVLTNIKTRGNWGEVQLGNLLEQLFTPDQYSANARVNPTSQDRVEFAIKLPGKGQTDSPVWLPIDAKFPREDYERLVDASERGDADAVVAHSAALENRICSEAKKIKEKYICPPDTVDFAILFLPTEGLYAEVLRRAGLCEGLLRDHRVLLAGPTTLAALLTSLQMGFRSLIIEKRSSEVWEVLGAVKSEFGKFGTVLEKVQKKLQEASNTVEQAAVRSRAVGRKLRNVQELPEQASITLVAPASGVANEQEVTPELLAEL